MKELVFLLEERSAAALLETMLPRLLHKDITPRVIPFDGKRDLQKQLTKKIRGYLNPHARFIVIQDQDGYPDCRVLKGELLQLCQQTGRVSQCMVRIACKELETFYLADLLAVEKALQIKNLAKHQETSKFRTPDRLGSPSNVLKELTNLRYNKMAGSRKMGQHLNLGNDRSASFRNLIVGIRRMQSELLSLAI